MVDNYLREVIPINLSNIDDAELLSIKQQLNGLKRELRRDIDSIDTELVGIKEELRKRREAQLAERRFPNESIDD